MNNTNHEAIHVRHVVDRFCIADLEVSETLRIDVGCLDYSIFSFCGQMTLVCLDTPVLQNHLLLVSSYSFIGFKYSNSMYRTP